MGGDRAAPLRRCLPGPRHSTHLGPKVPRSLTRDKRLESAAVLPVMDGHEVHGPRMSVSLVISKGSPFPIERERVFHDGCGGRLFAKHEWKARGELFGQSQVQQLSGSGEVKTRWGFRVEPHAELFDIPRRWNP